MAALWRPAFSDHGGLYHACNTYLLKDLTELYESI